MTHNRTFKKKLLSQIIAAGLVSGMGASAFAGDFVLTNNQISWDNGVTGTATLSTTAGTYGTAPDISLPQSTGSSYTLPDVSFSLEDMAGTTGTYYLRIVMDIVDTNNTQNVLEMSLGVVKVEVTSGDITAVDMVTSGANYEDIEVRGTTGGLLVQPAQPFSAKADMVSYTAGTPGTVKIEVNYVLDTLSDNNELFDSIIENFTSTGSFDYAIGVAVKNVANGAVSPIDIGVDVNDTFQASVFTAPTATLDGGALSGFFTGAKWVGGTLNITAASTGGGDTGGGDTGGEDEEPPVEEPEEDVVEDEVLEEQQQEAEQQEQAVDDELANLGEGEEVSEETVTNVSNTSNTVTNTTNTIVEAINSGTVVSKSNIVTTVTTAASATSTTTKVTSSTSNEETKTNLLTQTTTTLTNTATVLNSLGDRAEAGTTTLTAEETTQVREASTKLLTSAGNVATQTTDTTQLAQAAQAAAQVIQANTKLGIAADEETVNTTAQVSQQIATAAIRAVVGADVSDEEIAELFEENDDLAETVLNLALPVPPAVVETKSQRDEKIQQGASERGLQASDDAINRISNTTRQNIVQPANIVVGGVNIIAKLRNLFRGVSSLSLTLLDNDGRVMNVSAVTAEEADIVVDEATGAVKVILPGETYAGAIVSVKSVPASVPEGIRIRRDGRGVIVTGGVAVELAPVALDLLSFAAGVENAGFEFSMRNNATVSLNLGNNERFSGAFAYDNLDGQDVTTNCGAVSFAEPTGALNSAEYSFGVTCANGIEQKVQPFVDNADFFRSVEAAGFAVRADRDSGMVTIAGVGTMKPSFFVAPPTAAELEFHAANKDSFGIAYQAGDVNGDGLVDYKVISASGTQILYGTN